MKEFSQAEVMAFVAWCIARERQPMVFTRDEIKEFYEKKKLFLSPHALYDATRSNVYFIKTVIGSELVAAKKDRPLVKGKNQFLVLLEAGVQKGESVGIDNALFSNC